MAPSLVLHTLPPSHPCMTARRALQLKGLPFEEVHVRFGKHNEDMEELYGAGAKTVPGLMVDDEPVHGSRAILRRLEQLEPEPTLYPDAAVAEAEDWGDEVFQDLGRRLPWGALHFRPEMLGILSGAGQLDAAGTDFAIRATRAGWKYHAITAERLFDDLQGLPEKLDRIDAFVADGVVGGEQANAADLQIGATLFVLLSVGDLRPLIAPRPGAALASRWFGEQPSDGIPAGAYPAGWTPAP